MKLLSYMYRDLHTIYTDPPPGICVVPDGDNITKVLVDITHNPRLFLGNARSRRRLFGSEPLLCNTTFVMRRNYLIMSLLGRKSKSFCLSHLLSSNTFL